MTRRRKFMQRCSKRSILSSHANRQKPFTKKQRRRRRKQRRMRMRTRSSSTTTQIAVDALNMLQISRESNEKSLEFIERYELTRQDALAMSDDQQPIVVFRDYKNAEACSTAAHELTNDLDEDYSSSYA